MKIGQVRVNPETNVQEVHLDIGANVRAFAWSVFWYATLIFLGMALERAYLLMPR